MSEHTNEALTLEELDRDGALREAAHEVEGDTRASFFRKGGAFVAGGLALGSLPIAFASGAGVPSSDVKILNYALTLEYLEAAFYAEAVSKGALKGEIASFARTVAQHEAAHVGALEKALGSKATKKPKFDFKGTTADSKMFVKTAITLEDVGVTAYEGQVSNIKTGAVLAAAGSILPVEARHAAWIRDINGRGRSTSPAPNAFNPARSMSQVLSLVKGTGFIKS
jgi:rubrerythrin